MSDLERSWAERLGDAGDGAKAGAALGATLGSVVPGVGTAIGGAAGGVIGGVVALARSLTGQPHAEAEAPALAEAAEAITGVADAAQAVAVLAADPVKAEEFRVEALRVRAQAQAARDAHMLAVIQADAADRANARAADAQRTGVLRYATLGISVAIIVLYGALLWFIMAGVGTIPPDDMATLRTVFVACVVYWVGSSRGSAAKDERTADAAGQEPR